MPLTSVNTNTYNTQLFVTALWSEAKELYHWLCDNAITVATNTILKTTVAIHSIADCYTTLQNNNTLTTEFSCSPMLQCFYYNIPLSTAHDARKNSMRTITCILLVTGVGKVASSSTVACISSLTSATIIKIGSVLGGSQHLQQGDIVLPQYFAHHDIDLGNKKNNKNHFKTSNIQVLKKFEPQIEKINTKISSISYKKKMLEYISKTLNTESIYTDITFNISGDQFITLEPVVKKQSHNYTAINGTTHQSHSHTSQNIQKFTLPKTMTARITEYQDILDELIKQKVTPYHTTYHNSSFTFVIDMENTAVVQAAKLCNCPILVIAIVLDFVSSHKKVQFYEDIKPISITIKNCIIAYLHSLTFYWS